MLHYPQVRAFYLVQYLFDIGTHSNGGMGEVATSWQEIKAWQELVGIELLAWELQAIKNGSQAFVSMLQEARNINCPPPFRHQEVDQEQLAKKIKSIFRS